MIFFSIPQRGRICKKMFPRGREEGTKQLSFAEKKRIMSRVRTVQRRPEQKEVCRNADKF